MRHLGSLALIWMKVEWDSFGNGSDLIFGLRRAREIPYKKIMGLGIFRNVREKETLRSSSLKNSSSSSSVRHQNRRIAVGVRGFDRRRFWSTDLHRRAVCVPCARATAVCVHLAPRHHAVCVCLAPHRQRRATMFRHLAFSRTTLAVWADPPSTTWSSHSLDGSCFPRRLWHRWGFRRNGCRFFTLGQRYINFDPGFPRNHRCIIYRLQYTYKTPFSYNYMFLHGFLYSEVIRVP